MKRKITKVLSSMWLGCIWLLGFVLHVFLFPMDPPSGILATLNEAIFLSCFLVYGFMDRFGFNHMTVIGIALQFSFWWLVGVGLVGTYKAIFFRKLG